MLKKSIFFIISTILILSTFVYAAGSSTGAYSGSKTKTNQTQQVIVPDCEKKDTVRERIKCRLINKNTGNQTAITEESCRGLSNKSACLELYKISEVCYERTGIEKVMCFKEKAGIAQTLGLANVESKRKYAVLLLYELQERVEKKYENGEITADESADLINMIVEAKKTILNSSPREEIRQKMLDLRQKWREIMR